MDKIIGLGNALVDVLVKIQSDETLSEMQLPKGCMTLIDEDKYHIISKFFSKQETHVCIGGSAGNAIRALSHLGATTGFIGKVKKDCNGDFFRQSLEELGVEDKMLLSETLPTGVASTFISPDGQRTFGTYLGAAASLTADELNLDMFAGFSYLFIEGYLVQNHDLILRAICLAKEAGLQVCLDLASCNVVADDLEFFSLLINKYIDIVFANEQEAEALTGLPGEEAVDAIAKMCSVSIVKLGKRGVVIRKGTERIFDEAAPVPDSAVADTTGAGDYFAAGFLYGLTSGKSLERCARIGSILSGEVIQVIGTELTAERWKEIQAIVG